MQPRVVFFDLETQYLADEVDGGWRNIRGFLLSVAVTWDEEHGFRNWSEGEVRELISELAGFDKIIGYNLIDFDYEVLRGYADDVRILLEGKTFDILVDLRACLPYGVKWPSQEEVSSATLGRGTFGTGLDAVRWFREGEIEKVVEHCQKDVELTRDIYEHGRRRGCVHYCPVKGANVGETIEVKVDWG